MCLERVSVIRDLGVYFDSSLSFVNHVDYVISKSSILIGFIKRSTSDFSNITSIVHLYNFLVLPNLTYCSSIWSPFTKLLINKLELCQHKFLRYLAYKNNRPMSLFHYDYTPLGSDFGIPTIHSLHHYYDCLVTFKIVHNLMPSVELSNLFDARHRSSTFGFYSTLNRLKRSWNILPNRISHLNVLSLFKSALRSLVLKYWFIWMCFIFLRIFIFMILPFYMYTIMYIFIYFCIKGFLARLNMK